MRLSLAGAQDKLPVLARDGALLLPEHGAPSSHILKFPNRDLRHVTANEAFVNQLAGAVGLPVVELELIDADADWLALVRRYDRTVDADGHLVRMHQEDLCQALGLPASRKYEAEGGPSFVDVYRLVARAVTDPLRDTRTLLRWLAFNVLGGNADGHAKNLSLLHTPRGLVLAPVYDLICTRAYRQHARHLAMAVGSEADPGNIRGTHWKELAFALHVRERLVLDLVDELIEALDAALDPTCEHFQARHGEHPVLQMLPPVIRRQLRRSHTLLAR